MLDGRRRFGCCHKSQCYQQGTPRSGYRGSDFVLWHISSVLPRRSNQVGSREDICRPDWVTLA